MGTLQISAAQFSRDRFISSIFVFSILKSVEIILTGEKKLTFGVGWDPKVWTQDNHKISKIHQKKIIRRLCLICGIGRPNLIICGISYLIRGCDQLRQTWNYVWTADADRLFRKIIRGLIKLNCWKFRCGHLFAPPLKCGRGLSIIFTEHIRYRFIWSKASHRR